MDNIITYAETCLDTFDQRPFCDVDSLILSCLAYLDIPAALANGRTWRGMRLAELYRAEHFDRLFSVTFAPQKTRQLLTALAASPRFRDIRVMGYTSTVDELREKQFSAMTFRLAPKLSYIAFRGTDSTLVGWKEDFNMAFRTPIPAQQAARVYLTTASIHCPGTLLLGGHSKGGNLAVYAAAFCGKRMQSRIGKIYSHDGPGFLPEVLESADFSGIVDRIEKTLPQSSVVGMLLEQQEHYKIVKSKSISLLQHDPFNWEVRDGAFVPLDHLTRDARHLDRTLTAWLQKMDHTQRERLVEALFGILESTDVRTLDQLRADWQKAIPAVAREAASLDQDTREFLIGALKELAALSIRTLPASLKKE